MKYIYLILLAFLLNFADFAHGDWNFEMNVTATCAVTYLNRMFSHVNEWPEWNPYLRCASVTWIPEWSWSLLNVRGILISKKAEVLLFKAINADAHGIFSYKTTAAGSSIEWYWDFSEAALDNDEDLILKQGIRCLGLNTQVCQRMFNGKDQLELFNQTLHNVKAKCEDYG